jgi:vacuolar-type H+-ATPase subunit F/Vma7
MSVTAFIGDEVSAAGYRLCGVEVHIADRSNALSLINQACKRASLVLVASSTASYLDKTQLDQLMATITPPVLVVPDVAGRQPVPDITTRIHRQLGMLE